MNNVEEFFALSNRIVMDYEAITPLLRDPEVIRAARFLGELDKLANQYDFSVTDILKLIDPGRALDSERNKTDKDRQTHRLLDRSKR